MNAPYEAVILAAGRGSRLGDDTEARPNALLPLGPRAPDDPTETSFLRRQVELLRSFGVERVVVVVGYLRESIAAAIKSWALAVSLVVNPTPDIGISGSLHSFQLAVRSPHAVRLEQRSLREMCRWLGRRKSTARSSPEAAATGPALRRVRPTRTTRRRARSATGTPARAPD